MQYQVTRIPRPSLRWVAELLWSLSLYRVTLRYKESLFGFGWILLQPIALTIIFTYIFHRFAHVPSGGIPYPLFAATGLVAWSFTAIVCSQSAVSVSGHTALLKRIALPKLLLPASVIVAAVVDLIVMVTLLIAMFIYYHIPLSWMAWWILPLFAIHLFLLLGLSCLISLANVFIRDIGHALPSLLQLWFFASPVFYPSFMVPEDFSGLARWNPMTGLIEGYRSVLLLGQHPSFRLLIPTALVSLGLSLFGLYCFQRLEGDVSDIL